TASLHLVVRERAYVVESLPRAPVDPGCDLRVVGVARPCRPRTGVGCRTRTASVHHVRQPRRTLARDAKQAPAQHLSMMEDSEMSTTIQPAVRVETKRQPLPPRERLERIFNIDALDALYGGKPAIKDVTMDVYKNLVTAVIGPSGCGKSTFIRCLNRMND